MRLVKLQLVTSLVLLVRDYASLWLRLEPEKSGEAMEIFVASYLADLKPMLDIPDAWTDV